MKTPYIKINIDNISHDNHLVFGILNDYPLKYKTTEGQLLQYIIHRYIDKICYSHRTAVDKPSNIRLYTTRMSINLVYQNDNVFDEVVKNKFWQMLLNKKDGSDFISEIDKFIATDILFPQIFGRENRLLRFLPEIFDLFKEDELGNDQSSKIKFNYIHKNLGYFILKIIAYKLSDKVDNINTIPSKRCPVKLIEIVLKNIVTHYKDNIYNKHQDYSLYCEGNYIVCCLLYMLVITKLGMTKGEFKEYIYLKYLKIYANDELNNRIKQLIDYNFDNMVNHFLSRDSLSFKIDEDLP